MKRIAALPIALALAGCSTVPGTGWSRAPDLSVYAAMGSFGEIAREQSILCDGFSPGAVAQTWEEDFGARHAAVTAAMVARHGPDAVGAAADAREPRVPCESVPTLSWRHRYARLLRLLEARLGLA